MDFFLLFSDVLPENTTGGQVVLYRHLVERGIMDYDIVNHTKIISYSWWKSVIRKIGSRLEKTRLGNIVFSLKPFYDLFDFDKAFLAKYSANKPFFILTVAHDRACYKAQALAKVLDVPLVTIFHDWYPVSTPCNHKLLWFLQREFLNLHKASRLSLVVSEPMLEKLGSQSNSCILWPIPGGNSLIEGVKTGNSKVTKIVYSGYCKGAYSQMIKRLITFSSQNPQVELHISGDGAEQWNEGNSTLSNIKTHGLLPRNEYVQLLNDADILVVLIDFQENRKVHFSTHFPSKLVEYAGFNKPIIVWGPGYASSVQWAKQYNTAFVIDTNDELQIAEILSTITSNVAKREEISANCRNFYMKNWHPDVIHALLVRKINEISNA